MQIINKVPASQIAKDNTPKYLIVHHTGGENGIDTSNQTFEIVRDYHLSLGWETIGYHYYIDKKGIVTQGRADTYHGAHTKENDMNNLSLGICLAGNFDITLPTVEQINALTELLKMKATQYVIPAANIVPHRHFAITPATGKPYKSCFGNKLSDAWASSLIVAPVVLTSPVVQPLSKADIKKKIHELVELL